MVPLRLFRAADCCLYLLRVVVNVLVNVPYDLVAQLFLSRVRVDVTVLDNGLWLRCVLDSVVTVLPSCVVRVLMLARETRVTLAVMVVVRVLCTAVYVVSLHRDLIRLAVVCPVVLNVVVLTRMTDLPNVAAVRCSVLVVVLIPLVLLVVVLRVVPVLLTVRCRVLVVSRGRRFLHLLMSFVARVLLSAPIVVLSMIRQCLRVLSRVSVALVDCCNVVVVLLRLRRAIALQVLEIRPVSDSVLVNVVDDVGRLRVLRDVTSVVVLLTVIHSVPWLSDMQLAWQNLDIVLLMAAAYWLVLCEASLVLSVVCVCLSMILSPAPVVWAMPLVHLLMASPLSVALMDERQSLRDVFVLVRHRHNLPTVMGPLPSMATCIVLAQMGCVRWVMTLGPTRVPLEQLASAPYRLVVLLFVLLLLRGIMWHLVPNCIGLSPLEVSRLSTPTLVVPVSANARAPLVAVAKAVVSLWLLLASPVRLVVASAELLEVAAPAL